MFYIFAQYMRYVFSLSRESKMEHVELQFCINILQ